MKNSLKKSVLTLVLGLSSTVFFAKAEDTPLVRAIDRGFINRARSLIVAGADVNERSGFQDLTPLMSAVYVTKQGKPNIGVEMVQMLLEYKPDLNAVAVRDNTALHLALQNSKFRVAALLINAGAQVNMVNKAGETPLFLAVQRNNLGLVVTLVSRGAQVSTLDKNGKTVLDLARKRYPDSAIVKILEEALRKEEYRKLSWWQRWFRSNR